MDKVQKHSSFNGWLLFYFILLYQLMRLGSVECRMILKDESGEMWDEAATAGHFSEGIDENCEKVRVAGLRLGIEPGQVSDAVLSFYGSEETGLLLQNASNELRMVWAKYYRH
jgi:hypothetical protein